MVGDIDKERKHEKKNMLKCPQCGKFFTNKEEVIIHNEEAHSKKTPHIGRTRNIV
jgi:uncharacterized C2H2 Zn-finger protein